MEFPFVSVIIPVYNDETRLKKCLTALEHQAYPESKYEVIVVDNASTADIKGIAALFPHAVYAFESQPGSFFARNKGISTGRGEVIAFTDADCVPGSAWIENGTKKLLNEPNCGLVAGKVQVFFKDPNRPSIVELYEQAIAYKQEKYVRERHQGITANVFTFKKVVNKVGKFDVSLWELADYEWGRRVFTAGYRVVYADDACVLHPARYSIKELYHKATRLTGGFFELEKKKHYLKILPGYIYETYGEILSVLTNKKLYNIKNKFLIIMLILFMRCVYGIERLRLVFGAKPRR
jgi:glycosyltransferase involved in cell wall biosynthesis